VLDCALAGTGTGTGIIEGGGRRVAGAIPSGRSRKSRTGTVTVIGTGCSAMCSWIAGDLKSKTVELMIDQARCEREAALRWKCGMIERRIVRMEEEAQANYGKERRARRLGGKMERRKAWAWGEGAWEGRRGPHVAHRIVQCTSSLADAGVSTKRHRRQDGSGNYSVLPLLPLLPLLP
jgi:hypothetical protein